MTETKFLVILVVGLFGTNMLTAVAWLAARARAAEAGRREEVRRLAQTTRIEGERY